MTTGWHLAQVNIGRLVAPSGDPRVEPFFAALDRINALAEASPGFVWRLQDDDGNAMGIRYAPDPLLAINLTVWTDADALFAFVYRSAHTPVMARRREYFEPLRQTHQALWWVEAGTLPTVNDALAKLWLLERFGPCPQAFTFKARFPRRDRSARPSTTSPIRGASGPRDLTSGSNLPFGACPRCRAKTLFDGVIAFAPKCRGCGLDFSAFNVGDGPAAFLTLIIGAAVSALAIWVELAFTPPFWVHIVLWVPLTSFAVIAGLRAAKARLLAAEYRRKAGEARRNP